ncbi:hypothetical protein ISF_07132 [Cordyceps fumosorosea ARSEF 2679]|uniref:Uncharacterized protein n=1 Tax=Cordyceps fumosorosea (strain ARSEF 2679) TaxID=1081104 RepID=A0A167Q1Y1_CORFA|nr:hypothetical protein ISF_07132 [Cordyceps fumosorosea ARSEF 2679]OAA57211.1 hypothetical protein ISF_07132 [Cordyceps fumosorosea ARSEF 2679]
MPAKLCDGCAQVRGDKTDEQLIKGMKKLWCQGCLAPHTSMHFSLLQCPERMDRPHLHRPRGLLYVKLGSHCSASWTQAAQFPRGGYLFSPARRFADCRAVKVFDPRHCDCLDWKGAAVSWCDKAGCAVKERNRSGKSLAHVEGYKHYKNSGQ